MQIEILKKQDEKKWDEFVLNSTQSTYCHLLGWRNAIKKSYGHQDLYLVAKQNNKIKGILPLFLIKGPILGKKIISLPFLNYGGIVANNEFLFKHFVNYLKEYVELKRYKFFQLRSLNPASTKLFEDLSYFTFILRLEKNPDIIWAKIDKKVRNQVRKANKFNLKLKTGHQYLKKFYKLYQPAMKNLGTPTHSFYFFQNIIQQFPQQIKIFTVEFENKFIAGLILFRFKNILINPWAASDEQYRNINPNNFLYWEALKYACLNNFQYFDFGRSPKNSGTFNFKKQWSGDINQLYYQHYPYCPSSDREKYQNQAKAWSKLPSILTNFLGPKIRKYIP